MSDQLIKNKADPADKYLSNSVQFPNQLKHIVRFGVNPRGYVKELPIPESLQNHFWVSKLRDYIHMNPPKKSQVGLHQKTFKILLDIFSDNPTPNMRQFGSVFLKYAKSEINGSPKDVSDKARSLFRGVAKTSVDVNLQIQIKEFVGDFYGTGGTQDYGTWPKLSVDTKPRKSLEQRVDVDASIETTNELFVRSFSQFVYCYLKKWSDLRAALKNDHPELYANLVSFIESNGIDTVQRLEKVKSAGAVIKKKSELNAVDWQVYQQVWELQFEILEKLNENFLGYNAFAGMSSAKKHFEGLVVPLCDANNVTGSYLWNFRGSENNKYPWIAKTFPTGLQISPSLSFSLLDFLRPSKEENMCLYWLLGFMRIQKGNVEKLLNEKVFDTLIKGQKHHVVHSYKGRSKNAEPIPLAKNSPLGRSLTIYRSERNPENPPFEMEDFYGEYFVRQMTDKAFRLQGVRNFGLFLFDIDKNMIGFDNITDENFEFIQTIFKRYYRAPNEVTTSLAPAFFAQTKVYEDLTNHEAKITKKPDLSIPLNSPDRFEEEINAKKQFHTLETRESVYLSRSKSKAKLKVGEQLSVAMSDEMHATVNDLLEAKKRKTSVLSFTEIQQVIGLSDSETEASPEAILAAAQAQDYIVQRNGLITKNGQTYIFDCGLVARFMMEARAHIESNNGKGLEAVFLSQGRTRGLNIWAEYILLDHLIEHVLSPTSIQSAQKDYAYLEGKVPFVPLTEGGVL